MNGVFDFYLKRKEYLNIIEFEAVTLVIIFLEGIKTDKIGKKFERYDRICMGGQSIPVFVSHYVTLSLP